MLQNSNLQEEIERIFFGGFNQEFQRVGDGYTGPLTIEDEGDAYVVKKVLAGIEAKDIEANVRRSVLQISVGDEQVSSIRLDTNYLDVSKISSKLSNGILTIRVSKKKDKQEVKIKIN